MVTYICIGKIYKEVGLKIVVNVRSLIKYSSPHEENMCDSGCCLYNTV